MDIITDLLNIPQEDVLLFLFSCWFTIDVLQNRLTNSKRLAILKLPHHQKGDLLHE